VVERNSFPTQLFRSLQVVLGSSFDAFDFYSPLFFSLKVHNLLLEIF